MPLFVFTVLFIIALIFISKTFLIVHTRENVIKESLGKYAGTLEPGFHFMVPFIDRDAYRHEMREQIIDVPPQSCITRDNIQVEVDGFLYLKVVDAKKASYGVGDFKFASINLAQTTMRAEIGKLTLEETFTERESVNDKIIREIDKASEAWGVKVHRYEIRNITPSARVIETLEKQMEAERNKRASITYSAGQRESKINLSEGERQEAINLSEGEKQRRINEANGRAEEIRLLAEANAEGMRLIADAIQKPGGHLAVRTQVVEQYLNEFGRIVEHSQISVLPAGMANVKSFFEGVTQMSQNFDDSAKKK